VRVGKLVENEWRVTRGQDARVMLNVLHFETMWIGVRAHLEWAGRPCYA